MPLPVQVAFGPQQPSPLVAQLHAATAQGQGGVVALHLLASGLLGPAWEEVRTRPAGTGCYLHDGSPILACHRGI